MKNEKICDIGETDGKLSLVLFADIHGLNAAVIAVLYRYDIDVIVEYFSDFTQALALDAIEWAESHEGYIALRDLLTETKKDEKFLDIQQPVDSSLLNYTHQLPVPMYENWEDDTRFRDVYDQFSTYESCVLEGERLIDDGRSKLNRIHNRLQELAA